MKKRHLEESEAAYYYTQLISALEYIHKNNIVHRDIKPENLLLKENNQLTLIDFGLSNQYNSGQMLQTPCGSPCYAAPEMITGRRYNPFLVDIWSSGIVLYAMVCGYLPFEGKNNDVLYKKVCEGKFEIPERLSSSCKDLIKKILTINPQKRIHIEDIKHHPFLQSSMASYYFNYDTIDKSIICDAVIDKMILMNFNKAEIISALEKKKHNNISTTYHLLYKKYLINSSVFQTFLTPSQQSLSSNTTTQTGQTQSANKVVAEKDTIITTTFANKDQKDKEPLVVENTSSHRNQSNKANANTNVKAEDNKPIPEKPLPQNQLMGDIEDNTQGANSPTPVEVNPQYKNINKIQQSNIKQRQSYHKQPKSRVGEYSQGLTFREKNYSRHKKRLESLNSDNKTTDLNNNSMSLEISNIINQNKDTNIISIAPKLVPIKHSLMPNLKRKNNESSYYSSLTKKSQESSPNKGFNRVIDTSVTYDRNGFKFDCSNNNTKSKNKQMLYVPSNTINLIDSTDTDIKTKRVKKGAPNCSSFNKRKNQNQMKIGDISINQTQYKRAQSENEKDQNNKTTRTNNNNNKYLWTFTNEYKEEGRKNNFDLINNEYPQRKDNKSFEKNYLGTSSNEPNLRNSTGYNFHKAVYDLRKRFKTLSIIDTSKITNQSILSHNNNTNMVTTNSNRRKQPNEVKDTPLISKKSKNDKRVSMHTGYCPSFTENSNPKQMSKYFPTNAISNTSKEHSNSNINSNSNNNIHTDHLTSFIPKKKSSEVNIKSNNREGCVLDNRPVSPQNFFTQKIGSANLQNPHRVHHPALKKKPTVVDIDITEQHKQTNIHQKQQKLHHQQQQPSASNSQKNIKLTSSKPKANKNQIIAKKTCLKINISGGADVKNPETPKTEKSEKGNSSKNTTKLNLSSTSNNQSSSSYRTGNMFSNTIKKKPIQKQIEEDIPTKNKIISSSNDFALCTANSDISEIRNKLLSLAKKNVYTVTEVL